MTIFRGGWLFGRAAIVIPNLGGRPPKSVWEDIWDSLGGHFGRTGGQLGGHIGRTLIFMIVNYAMVLNVKYLHRYVPVYLALFI